MRPAPLAAACAALLLAACEPVPAEPEARVENAWVRLPAAQGRPGAAYFEIRTNRATRIENVTSPLIERIELHETVREGNVTRMQPLRERAIERELTFEPGGAHAMLFGIDPRIAPGATLPLIFQLDGMPQVTVEAEVRAPGDGAPEPGHGHR